MEQALLIESSLSKLNEQESDLAITLRDFELALVGGGIGDTVGH